ncbi:MAG: protein-export chaperone SecB [Gemmatimonadales bacterium]
MGQKKAVPPTEQPAVAKGVRFVGLATRAVNFQENASAVGVRPERGPLVVIPTNLEVGVGVVRPPSDPTLAEVTLRVSATPDQSFLPYQVVVAITGSFKAPNDTNEDAFAEFCRQAAPAILWPYARALITQVTADARFGPLRLDPVNLTALLRKDGWQTAQPASPAEPATKRSKR